MTEDKQLDINEAIDEAYKRVKKLKASFDFIQLVFEFAKSGQLTSIDSVDKLLSDTNDNLEKTVSAISKIVEINRANANAK